MSWRAAQLALRVSKAFEVTAAMKPGARRGGVAVKFEDLAEGDEEEGLSGGSRVRLRCAVRRGRRGGGRSPPRSSRRWSAGASHATPRCNGFSPSGTMIASTRRRHRLWRTARRAARQSDSGTR